MEEQILALLSRAFPYSSYIPRYINGLQISNDSSNPNTVLNISEGSTTDSTSVFQIGLSATASINTALTGLGGIDTGTLAANTLYAIYLVADPVKQQPSGCMFSLSLTGPLMPFGYNAYKLIGYFAVDNSSHIIPAYWTGGDSSNRTCMYVNTVSTQVLSGGASTTWLAIPLTKFVPAQPKTLVWVSTSYKGNAVGNEMDLRTYGSNSAGMVDAIAQVTATTIDNLFFLNSDLTGFGAPSIDYQVTSASDTLSVWVNGYNFIL